MVLSHVRATEKTRVKLCVDAPYTEWEGEF